MSEIIKSNPYEKIGNKFYYEEEYVKEKDKEIERLKKDNKYLNKVNIELSTEKNRLNNIINNNDVYGYIKHLEDLITKKDTVINEFEKYLIEEIEDYEKQIKYHKKNKDLRSRVLDLVGEYEGEKVCFEDMLGKLQELKGSGKE